MRRRRAMLAGNVVVTCALATATILTWPHDAAPRPPVAFERRDGQVLFATKGCAACHFGPDGSGQGLTGIALATVTSPVAGTSREEYIRESITRPGAVVGRGGTGSLPMPTLPLTEREVDQLVRYLSAGT